MSSFSIEPPNLRSLLLPCPTRAPEGRSHGESLQLFHLLVDLRSFEVGLCKGVEMAKGVDLCLQNVHLGIGGAHGFISLAESEDVSKDAPIVEVGDSVMEGVIH